MEYFLKKFPFRLIRVTLAHRGLVVGYRASERKVRGSIPAAVEQREIGVAFQLLSWHICRGGC